jgi:hypothetical protein
MDELAKGKAMGWKIEGVIIQGKSVGIAVGKC